MFIPNINDYKIILATQSPRRHYLLKEIGLEFEIKSKGFVDESYPEELKEDEIPLYIAKKKASVFNDLHNGTEYIFSDLESLHGRFVFIHAQMILMQADYFFA